jgi:hypothetical protein
MSTVAETIELTVTDVSEQKTKIVRDVPTHASVRELVRGLLPSLRLPENDVGGRPVTYHARLEREGRHLHDTELVGEALESGDRVVLQPDVNAG